MTANRQGRGIEFGGLIAGFVLVLIAILFRDSVALATVLGIGGVALILGTFFRDRLKSVGPKGVELFEATKETIAEKIDADAGLAKALQTNRGVGQAAAAIRSAKTPDELANVLVKLLDRPMPSGKIDPYALIEAQDELRRRGFKGSGR